jgi:hypothetical protein
MAATPQMDLLIYMKQDFPLKKNMKHDFFIISKEGKKICYHFFYNFERRQKDLLSFFIISKEGKKIALGMSDARRP